MGHATLSPSSAERWMTCPGSVRLCATLPDTPSAYADEGTAAHELAERILRGESGEALVGQAASNGIVFDAEMLEHVQRYTAVVQALRAQGALLFVEQRLPIADWTGEYNDDGDPAGGTADAVLVIGDEIVVADLKYGRGVEVEADSNKQLMLYALAAVNELDLAFGPFRQARLIISQPRLGSLSEWVVPIDELRSFGEQVKAAAQACRSEDAPLVPGEKACRFCRAKAVCPALREQIVESMGLPSAPTPDDFADLVVTMPDESDDADWLSAAMGKIPLIEAWCKAVRAEVERRLLGGQPVPGYKLVQGKQGQRKWADVQQVEALLKHFRLRQEQMYDMTVISPTVAEKLTKPGVNEDGTPRPPVLGPRQWAKLQEFIVRSPGQPSVAPVSDKRPAITLSDARDMADLI